MEELRIAAGAQLDPDLVEVFINIPIELIEDARDSVEAQMKDVRSLGVYKKETGEE